MTRTSIPIIDISRDLQTVAREVGKACAENGFFCISHHGVSPDLELRLEKLAHEFFALPAEEKLKISMHKGGKAWRGFFPVGDELTSGHPDLKEGLYFGEELPASDARVVAQWPLHGKNLFPARPPMQDTVIEYMKVMTELGQRLMEIISLSLNLNQNYFREHYTSSPTELFRIFHYPPSTSKNASQFPWGVGEHTDYGLLTILKQDDCGGLEVKSKAGWIPVPPIPGTFVCNIGDMLDYLTQGRYRSTPHRVRNTSGRERFSYPFFFDPGFSSSINPLPNLSGLLDRMADRWDKADLYQFNGTYRDYLLKKVSKVFPDLAQNQIQ